jgi:hypothetical protein
VRRRVRRRVVRERVVVVARRREREAQGTVVGRGEDMQGVADYVVEMYVFWGVC